MFGRGTLSLIAANLVAACTPNRAKQQLTASGSAGKSQSVFKHGVASGDPDSNSVVIWTRVTYQGLSVNVDWAVSADKNFSAIESSGSVITDARQDFTVKAIVGGLVAGQTYYYRFNVGGAQSPIGRTKTMPVGDIPDYTVALASCSNFPFGYFNAYDAIANDPQIDLVLHTGDYIYEYAANEWGKDLGEKLNRAHQPPHEIVSLADYRTRHAQYKTDKGSQAMHAAHPFVCCWDDHESANNPWLNGASNHQPETEGSWEQRRAVSIQAYYEWMPIRDPKDIEARKDFTRKYRIGNLGDLITLESRHTARAEQINYADKIQSQDDASQFMRDVINVPDRKMISDTNQQLVKQTFKESIIANRPWRILGNASPIARMLVPDIEGLGVTDGESTEQLASDAAKSLFWKGKYNLPFYTDTWDGYPWARERFYKACKEVGVQDLIFLTGDSHNFWVNQLADAQGDPMGVELGTAGITSPGDFVDAGWKPKIASNLDRSFEDHLDEVVWTDSFHQGFVKLQLGQHQAKASYIAVSTLLSENYTTSLVKQVLIQKDKNRLKIS
ncbi:MAG: alkaline phosphatase D [Arenicella sp.]